MYYYQCTFDLDNLDNMSEDISEIVEEDEFAIHFRSILFFQTLTSK